MPPSTRTQPLPDLLKHHARTRPQQVVFSTPHRNITFAALATRTHCFAIHLDRHAGTSCVAIVLPRCIEFVETLLAVTRASRVGVPLDWRASIAELRWALRDAGARVVVTDARGVGRVRAAVEVTGVLIVVVNASEDTGDTMADVEAARLVRYEEWTQKELSDEKGEQVGTGTLDNLRLDEPAWMHYTSGTTGTPKGVLSSQRGWLVSATNYAKALGITSNDKLFWPLPLYHAFGHSLCIIGTLIVGASVHLTGQNEGIFTSILGCQGLTIMAGVPSTYRELATEFVRRTERGDETRLPQPRMCITGGGHVPAMQFEDACSDSLSNNYGNYEAGGPMLATATADIAVVTDCIFNVPLLNRYGCTESCGAITANTLKDVFCENACGAPLSHIELRVVRVQASMDCCDSVADGEEGEIWIRGPSMMIKYWNSQPQQAPFTDGGWYRTGDLGCRLSGPGGQISITGRLNELIRRGSETIYPAEVERIVRLCPGVGDVVVTGVPHSLLGETTAAFLVRASEDAKIDLVVVLAACRARLPDYKVPTVFFEIEALPRTKAGKLRRRAVLDCQSRPLNARSDLTQDAILALVLAEVRGACNLGLEEHVDVGSTFADLGVHSLAGVVLRDRLASLTGLKEIPTTLVFDQPTPKAVSEYLCGQLIDKIPCSSRRTGHPQGATTSIPKANNFLYDSIAVVSMDCRYPGSVNSPADLWDVVASGTDVTSCFPIDRGWNLDALFKSEINDNGLRSRSGTSATARGGFLTDAAHFDTTPFHISPREALATDPQRLLLETTWHLAERAHIAPSALSGSNTGVFIGVMYSDYAGRFLNSDPHGLDSHLGLGSASSVAAGRISYTFNLRGPSIAIDTACSSSIVAIDLAAKSLRSGECALAIAGGVTVMATPRPFIMFSRQGGLAPDGRCKSYSAGADGTAWSEGVGLLMLERLFDAQRNGHKVLGLIRGSAVNSDGASNGLMAPSCAAQEKVIRQALENAGLGPDEVDVLEGHGTATILGDAIEAQAVMAVYGHADREIPMLPGSVKSNMGHTQAAAGVAGVIRMMQAMKHGVVPKSLYVDKPSPHIAKKGRIELITESRPWPCRKTRGPRRAAVSSFGIGGTNSHIILEEYVGDVNDREPSIHLKLRENAAQGAFPWLLSSADQIGLRAQAEALLAHERQGTATDIAFSLATTRSPLPHRAAILWREGLGGIEGPMAALIALAQNHNHPDVVTSILPGSVSRLIFMFSGQASLTQHSTKGIRDLCAHFPAFDKAFRAVCNKLDPLLAHPLSDTLRDNPEDLFKHPDLSQATIFASEVAMFHLLKSFGVHPDAVVGHSLGEIAAAHVADYLSLAGAAALISTRGKLMAELPGKKGTMASISASEEDVAKTLVELVGREGECTIAAVNAHNSVVISGSLTAVTAVMDAFASQGHRVKLLKGVDHAFHSPFMEPMLEKLSQALAEDFAFCSASRAFPEIPLISTVTGKIAGVSQLSSPEYWARQVRAPVRFADAVDTLNRLGSSKFLEVGPSAPLSAYVPGAIATQGGVSTLLEALGRLWACGIQINWNVVFEGSGARSVELPVYQFQRRRYWLDPPGRSTGVPNAHGAHNNGMSSVHPILTGIAPIPGMPDKVVCHGYLSLELLPWLVDHGVDGQPVVPAMVLAELVLSAGRECQGTMPMLEELAMLRPLKLTAGTGITIQVVLNNIQKKDVSDDDSDACQTADIYARPQNADVDQEWTRHATGALKCSPNDLTSGMHKPVREWQSMDLDADVAYAALAAAGITYGPTFQCICAVWRSEDGLFLRAQIRLPDQVFRRTSSQSFPIHPVLLDVALHVGVFVFFAENSAAGKELCLPFLLKGVQILQSLSDDETAFVTMPSRRRLGDSGSFAMALEDRLGHLVAVVGEVVTRPWKPTSRAAALFRLEWTPLTTGSIQKSVRKSPQIGADEIIQTRGLLDPPDLSLPDAVHVATAHVLSTIQRWALGQTFASGGRLVIVTEKASGSDPALTSAAIWGLVRSAQAEFGPDRLMLVDLDGTVESGTALPQAIACGQGLVGLRSGKIMTPKLSRFEPMPLSIRPTASSKTINTSGTVLITGGTGALGALLARHVVRMYNVERLVLISRLGPNAPGADALLADLSSAGATTRILACDVTDRTQLLAIFSQTYPPVTAIIHAAGTLDDGTLSLQTPNRVSGVLRPKVDGAWFLHELAPSEAQLFLFSSAAGLFGNRGQAGYAAGNRFLDGLAEYRRLRGLHGLSLAWGPWENVNGMAGGVVRSGMLLAVSNQQGLDAFDAAVRTCSEEALIIPLLLRERSVESKILLVERQTPPLFKFSDKTTGHTLWKDQLDAIQMRDDHRAALGGLVHNELAQVLGYQTGEKLPNRPFSDLGMDSFTAIQFRNRLSMLSGLNELPPTLAFDANTLTALVESLLVRFDEVTSEKSTDRRPRSGVATHTAKTAESSRTGSRIGHESKDCEPNHALPDPRGNALRGLASLFRSIYQAGKYNAAAHLLAAASLTLSKFTTTSSLPVRPTPRRLASGCAMKPALLFLPDFTPRTSEGESRYTSLAAAMGNEYDIYELPHPTVPVPDSLDALAEVHADTLRDVFPDKPVILIGFSAGGCIAHALAHRMTSQAGDRDCVVGLVLIDTYTISDETTAEWLMRLALPANSMLAPINSGSEEDGQLAVFGGFLNIIAGWRAAPLPERLQTLFVRAREATPGAGLEWHPAEWLPADRTVDVPGHHLAILDERHAGTVGEAIRAWIEEIRFVH